MWSSSCVRLVIVLYLVHLECSTCCSVKSVARIQTTWRQLMLSLDTPSKLQILDEIVADLDTTNPYVVDVISGRLLSDPDLHVHYGIIQDLSVFVNLLSNPRALERHLSHYVLRNHVGEGEEVETVAKGLKTIFGEFFKINDLDPGVWRPCIQHLTKTLRQKASDRASDRLFATCDVTNPETGEQQQHIHGRVIFEQPTTGGSTAIKGTIRGFDVRDANTKHGFHIHDIGATGNGCKDAGGHYNPDGMIHGRPRHKQRHVGDLGSISEDEDGTAEVNTWDDILTLVGDRSVINRSVVIHASADGLALGNFTDSKMTGHAGGRIGCCVIKQLSG